uniref:Putative mov34/mpn/pad-1 family: histone h2a deubiquitinase n=1 Tax=Ixodes ricinus TaxID=34613 RepID=A0A0K8RMJ0_IXORI
MQMMYNVAQDSFLTQDLLMEMRLLSEYYRGSPDSLNFCKDFEPHSISYWEKLKRSLTSKLPRDLQVTSGDYTRPGRRPLLGVCQGTHYASLTSWGCWGETVKSLDRLPKLGDFALHT